MAKTKQVGDLAESKFIARCIEKGYSVSKPFGEDQRYDLIVDQNNNLFRVQVKATWGKETEPSVLHFNTCSTNSHTGHKGYTKKSIDAFGLYSRRTDSCYWVPVEETPKAEMVLRITEPKNGQSKKINFAEDYLF